MVFIKVFNGDLNTPTVDFRVEIGGESVAVIAAVAGQRLSRVMIVRHFASNVSFAPVDQFFGVFFIFHERRPFLFRRKILRLRKTFTSSGCFGTS